MAEPLQSSRLVRTELRQILAAYEVTVGLQIPHGAIKLDDVLDRRGIGDQVVVLEVLRLLDRIKWVSIPPSLPTFSRVAAYADQELKASGRKRML